MAEWRELTECEKGCVQTLLHGTDWAHLCKIEELVGLDLDEFGSLALSTRVAPAKPDLKTSPIVSGYFSDGQEDFPVGEILLFEKNGALTELQIFCGDGAPLKREFDPTRIIMIRQERQPYRG